MQLMKVYETSHGLKHCRLLASSQISLCLSKTQLRLEFSFVAHLHEQALTLPMHQNQALPHASYPTQRPEEGNPNIAGTAWDLALHGLQDRCDVDASAGEDVLLQLCSMLCLMKGSKSGHAESAHFETEHQALLRLEL